jgi:hypothetical protein
LKDTAPHFLEEDGAFVPSALDDDTSTPLRLAGVLNEVASLDIFLPHDGEMLACERIVAPARGRLDDRHTPSCPRL